MKTLPRTIAVFQEIKQVSQYVTECRVIVTLMTGNKNVPNPVPPLAQVSAHLDTLAAAEESVHKGGMGAAEQRDLDLSAVRNDMRLLRAYVQSVADKNPHEAEAIITSVGMGLGKKRLRTKPPLAAKQGSVSGSVVVEARALPQPVQYRWQMSTDQETWTDLAETFVAKVTASGLTPATIYYFRFRAVTRGGLSDWSSIVSIIVH